MIYRSILFSNLLVILYLTMGHLIVTVPRCNLPACQYVSSTTIHLFHCWNLFANRPGARCHSLHDSRDANGESEFRMTWYRLIHGYTLKGCSLFQQSFHFFSYPKAYVKRPRRLPLSAYILVRTFLKFWSSSTVCGPTKSPSLGLTFLSFITNLSHKMCVITLQHIK